MFFDIGLVDIQQPQTFVLYSYWPVKVLSEVDSAVAGVPHPLRRVKDVRDAQQTEVLSIPSRCLSTNNDPREDFIRDVPHSSRHYIKLSCRMWGMRYPTTECSSYL